MPKSQVDKLVLTPADSQIGRFLDVDSAAILYSDAVKHLKKMTLCGWLGFLALGFLAWQNQSWMALISLIFWITISGVHFIPQARRQVTRLMNHMIARMSFLEDPEKALYVQRKDSVALGRREVAHQLGRDVC